MLSPSKFPAVRIFILLVLLLSVTSARAQKQGQALIDSVLQALPSMADDTNKVTTLSTLAFNYRLIDDTLAIRYGNECLALAQKLGWSRGIGKAHNTLGNCYKASSDYPKALEHYFLALSEFEKGGHKRDEAIVHMNIGTVYRPLHDYDKALEQYDKALPIAIALNDQRLHAQLLGNKGVIYFQMENYAEQQKMSLEALAIFRKIGDRNNEAWILSNLGDSYATQGDFATGIRYHLDAIAIYDELNNQSYKASSLMNIGDIYYDMAVAETDPEKKAKALDESIAYLQLAATILQTLNDPDYLKDVYLSLAASQEMAGKTADALLNYRKYTALKDSVFSAEVEESIAQLETQREIEVREREIEIERLKKRTEYIYLFGGIGVLLLVTGFTISNNRRQRRLNKLLGIEKEKSENLLLNILPSEVAAELKEKGSADARQFDQVTVLFTDFKGFTSIAEKLSPKELVAEIDTCFREFDRIMGKYNVEKIKTIGDAYMAAGGLPVANRTNASDVVRAALEIQQFMTDLAARKAAEGKTGFQIRIGVHSGPVVAGIVGVKKFAYDIWGDTVNTASRMESSGEPGQVNISETTYQLVKDQFNCVHRGKIPAKNKGEIDMYFVAGTISDTAL